jgi:glycosyltransferase involved in cell wall biosynthesis
VGELKRMLGGTGILVKSGDALYLAEGILTLLGDKTLRDKIGKFARERIERSYSWSNTAACLLSAYKNSLEN